MELEKSLLVWKESVMEAVLEMLGEFKFCHLDGKRCVGSFIDIQKQQQEWMAQKVVVRTVG